MDISVIICTYNRHALLLETIQSLYEINYNEGSFEVLIVDNNSNDSTKAVVYECIASLRLNLKYIFEESQGHSYARNAGIRAASFDTIVFTDDDVSLDSEWLKEIAKTFNDNLDAVAVGGPVRPIWIKDRPEWLDTDWLLEPLAINDFEQAKQLGYFKGYFPYGANMAFKKSVFEKYGFFATDLGRKGNKLLTNDDLEIMQRLDASNCLISFSPKAIVHHKIDPDRLTKHWYYRRYYWQGRSDAVIDVRNKKVKVQHIKNLLCAILASGAQVRNLAFKDRCLFNTSRGYLHQLLIGGNNDFGNNEFSQIRTIETILHIWRNDRKHNKSALECQESKNDNSSLISRFINKLFVT